MFDAGVFDCASILYTSKSIEDYKTLSTTRYKFASNQALSYKSIAHNELISAVFRPRPLQTCNGEAIISPFPAH